MGATHTLCCPHDIKGPAAICQSVTKIDHSQAGNGTLLNWKFSPAALEGDVGRDNLIHLLETYVQRKYAQSVHRGQQGHAAGCPGKSRRLQGPAGPCRWLLRLLRRLSKELQNDIIGRTELSF